MTHPSIPSSAVTADLVGGDWPSVVAVSAPGCASHLPAGSVVAQDSCA